MTNDTPQSVLERIKTASDQLPDPVKNVAQVVGGTAIAAVGIPMLVLPGPGLATIATGAAIAGNGAYKLFGKKADGAIEVEPVEVTAVDPEAGEPAAEPAVEEVQQPAPAEPETEVAPAEAAAPAVDFQPEAAAEPAAEPEAYPAAEEPTAEATEPEADAAPAEEPAAEAPAEDAEAADSATEPEQPASKFDEAKAAFAKASAEAEAAAKRFVDFAHSDLIPAGKACAAEVAQKAPEFAQASVAEAKRAGVIGKDLFEQSRVALQQEDKRAAFEELGENTVKPLARDLADAAVTHGKAAAATIAEVAVASKDLAVKGAYAVVGKEQPVAAEEPAAEPTADAAPAAEEPLVEVVPDSVIAPDQQEVPEPVAVQDAEAEEVVEE